MFLVHRNLSSHSWLKKSLLLLALAEKSKRSQGPRQEMATVPPEFPRDREHRGEARKIGQACQNPEALLDFMIFRIPILLGPHHHWLA